MFTENDRISDHSGFYLSFLTLALAHRAVIAFRAISCRCSGVIVRSRALPPFRPNATALGSFSFFVIAE